MENERPIEKLLRDYAKKRRADAGEPRQMHPATRRLLQGEVARQFPKAQREGSIFSAFLNRWRRGLVYAACALAVVALSVPLLLPMFRTESSDAQLAAAPKQEATDKNFATPAATATETDQARAREDASALRFEEVKRTSVPTRSVTTDATSRSAPTPPPPSQATGRDQVQTPVSLAVQSESERPVLESRADAARGLALDARRSVAEEPAAVTGEKLESSRSARPSDTTAAPAAPVGGTLAAKAPGAAPVTVTAPALADSQEAEAFKARYGLPGTAATAVVQRFTQVQPTAGPRRTAEAAAAISPVLTTFQLEQTGDQLRIVDSDGSTYTGAISPPAVDRYAATTVETKGKPLQPGSAAASQAISAPAEGAYQMQQNFYFRVAGTNRTLQQPVVFAGNLLVLTNALTGGATTLTQLPATRSQNQFTPAQQQLPMLQNSTISGKVQLGTSRELQIKAVPVNP